MLSLAEAALLLRSAEVTLGEDDVAALYQRTEGWPAGLYLAALYLREGGAPGTAAVSFGGDDRLVSEYMEAEFLARIPHWHRVFLLRRRAVSWCLRNDLPEEALEYSITAGDVELAQWDGAEALVSRS